MIEKVPPLVCKGKKNLTFYQNGVLRITPGENVRKVDYQILRRKRDTGQGYDVFRTGTLTPSDPEVELNEDMVYLEVQTDDGDAQREFHLDVRPRKEYVERSASTKSGIPLNVMMVGMDSTSHAHFHRKLGAVYEYLRDELHSVIFNGHSIVGDGTTENVVGMLVGRFLDELPEGRKGRPGAECIDRWPLIFKDMREHGYVTYYSETRFWNEKVVEKGTYIKGHCLGSQAIYNVSFDAVQSFLDAYPNTPKFGFQFNADFCHHESFNFISLVEDRLFNFLKHLKDKNYLNNTLLILFGDHGLRYGFVRSSILGRMEERLPFLSMTFPPWFQASYPELYANLRRNAEVLTSHFDIHATLQHLLTYPKEPQGLPHGRSLFTDIGWRTCEQAGIPFHYCPCLDWDIVSADHKDVQMSGLAVVSKINRMLKETGIDQKCATLKLEKVKSAILIKSKIGGDEESRATNVLKGGCMYQLQVETTPNNGLYEATVQMIFGEPHVNPQISRINQYRNAANSGHWVDGRHLPVTYSEGPLYNNEF
ncbi:uncharacterized protein LOC114533029 [Dendronephthya gigantea]|uniref:uncharacterized protein LOC114533029 n=1 Tax=Dendronephthya gigantea TaxID=151771 RepID=UPI00106D278A|nr:uncharacterized protein LOC114533029 [Dendronephthya gigantea]